MERVVNTYAGFCGCAAGSWFGGAPLYGKLTFRLDRSNGSFAIGCAACWLPPLAASKSNRSLPASLAAKEVDFLRPPESSSSRSIPVFASGCYYCYYAGASSKLKSKFVEGPGRFILSVVD